MYRSANVLHSCTLRMYYCVTIGQPVSMLARGTRLFFDRNPAVLLQAHKHGKTGTWPTRWAGNVCWAPTRPQTLVPAHKGLGPPRARSRDQNCSLPVNGSSLADRGEAGQRLDAQRAPAH